MSHALEQYAILHDSDKAGQAGRDQGDRSVHRAKPSQMDELAAAIAPQGAPPSGELEVYEDTEAKESLGTMPSHVVHTSGMLHRTAYAWLVSTDGCLLLYRRSPIEQLCPDCWDCVWAHVRPGETPTAAAVRAVQDKLGLALGPGDVKGPLAPSVHRRMELAGGSLVENEMAESFLLACPAGTAIDRDKLSSSVKDAVWLPLARVRDMCASEPDTFSYWFREEVGHLAWFDNIKDFPGGGAGGQGGGQASSG